MRQREVGGKEATPPEIFFVKSRWCVCERVRVWMGYFHFLGISWISLVLTNITWKCILSHTERY